MRGFIYSTFHGQSRLSRVKRERREQSLVRQWLCTITGHYERAVDIHNFYSRGAVDWGLCACRCGRRGSNRRGVIHFEVPDADL